MADQPDSLVLREDSDGVAVLTLNRPNAYNALSIELMESLLWQLEALAEDPSVRALVLRGSGRGFCAGHDLRQMTAGDATFQAQTFQTCSTLMQQITRQPQPVIAQVHGIATAAGCQLVATCDLAVCADSARFATPGVNIGLFCSTPMVALTRAVSRKHAMEMLLLGEAIDAARAYEIGLVNRVVAEADLAGTARALAAAVAAKSGPTVQLGKAAFYRQLDAGLAEAYAHCTEVMSCNLQSDDAREGIDAFLNKRPPRWKGRYEAPRADGHPVAGGRPEVLRGKVGFV